MSETFYVTTPIYYVNDAPHIGHSYTTIAADVLARFHRAQGRRVHFLTGTDEHGIKIVKAAAEKHTTPSALAEATVVHYQRLWRELDITCDDFIRTTQPRHERRVRELVRRLVAGDEVYLGQYEGWYDEGQEEFVPESTAREGQYKSALSGRPLVRYSEPSYFFRLAKWAPRLIEHIEAHPHFVRPESRRNEVLSKLRLGVEDLSISRHKGKLSWGVEMPNDPQHVVYVWIDALSNYYTALGAPPVGDEWDGRWEQFWPADLHLIGKDILWFHAVYWPCMLLALDLPLPRTVFAHGWWTSEGKKMSKSLGNFVSQEVISGLCGDYSSDVFRYFVLREVPFGADGDFSRDALRTRYNTELANDVGNLLSRTVNMIGRYFDGACPPGAHTPAAEPVRQAAAALRAGAGPAMDLCQFHVYLDAVLALAGATNKFIDVTEPFRLAKDPARREELAGVLATCAEAVRIVLTYLEPFMPRKVRLGLEALGQADLEGPLGDRGHWGRGRAPAAVTRIDPLFPRMP